ncbi:MAG TPA: dienelactone hydrolase family protein [Thermoanaerobaculia bacterium]|nr:dienelactone hydrolase family protein [Thermoanaerobaculia bacterium]
MTSGATDPHRDQPVLTAGRPLAEARAAMILLHGRGADGEDMLGLARHLHHPELAYLAPEAAGRTWYPERFTAPREANEPWLGSALARVGALVEEIAAAGVPTEHQILLGFSQGACLACDLVARHPRRYGGLAALTGGLIGPPGTAFEDLTGDLAGTPAYLAGGDPDPHVPWSRVEETAEALRRLGAEVTVRRFPGLGHTVHPAQIAVVRRMVENLVPGRR